MSLDFHRYKTIKISAYSHSMNASMLEAFKEFARLYIAERKPIAKVRIPLEKTEYGNWAKLKFAGIIEQHKKGWWILTPFGEDFYHGRVCILSPWGWFEGAALQPDHEAWKTFTGKRHEIWIHSDLSKRVKRSREYEKEKRGDTLLGDEVMEKIERGKRNALAPHITQPAQQSMFQQNVTE